jgi:Spy/CpxP family protein refolding chaperone
MTPPVPSLSPPSGRRMALVVLLLAVLAGGLAGVALDRLVLLPRPFRGPRLEHGPGSHSPRDREFRRHFARELNLSADQQVRIDSIMDLRGRELRAIRRQVQPQLDSIIGRTRRQLDSVLTPEQRKKAEEIRHRHPRPPGHPPDGVTPGDPGPPAGEPPP